MTRAATLALAAAYLATGDLSAHHSPAPFDLEQTATIEGTVTRFDWANPHVYVDVEVTAEDGSADIWEVEAAWPASLVPLGWSRDTLKPGDRVTVTGNPGRNPARPIMLGRSLRIAGRTLVLNVEPGAPVVNTSLTDQDRTGVPAAEALGSTWLPLESEPFVLLNPEFTSTPGPRLTERAQAALKEGRLLMGDETELEAARCVPQRPPLNMIFHEPKAFEIHDDRIVIHVAVVGDTQRIVYMGEAAAGNGVQTEQGRSIGRWEGDALLVRTTFDADTGSDRGIINGVPLSGDTQLIERFELSEDRRQLVYTYSVENPEYLLEPFAMSADWAYRPDIEVPRLECDPEIAKRFLADLSAGLAPVNGGQIEYVVSGPEDGEPVLLIHGAMLGSAFAPMQDAAALDDYRVIRMHRRGFEGSSDDAPPLAPLAGHAADAVALLDALGVERAHVVGHSVGALISLRLAIDAPERVHTLALVDSAPLPGMAPPAPPPGAPAGADSAPAADPVAASLSALAAGDVEGAVEIFASFVFGDDWRDYFDAVPGGYEQTLADLRRLSGAPPPVPPFQVDRIAAIDPPVLVAWGEDGAFAAPSQAMIGMFANAEGVGITGTDHALITQKPDEVAAAIADFLRRHPM